MRLPSYRRKQPCLGGQLNIEINDAQIGRFGEKGHGAIFGEEYFTLRVGPVHDYVELVAFRMGALHDDMTDIRLGVRRIVLPKLHAVHVVIREPQAPMMRVVAAFALDVFHRPAARDVLAVSRTQGRHEGLAGVLAVMERSEGFAIDLNVYLGGIAFVVRSDVDLCGERGRSCEAEQSLGVHWFD